MEKVRSPGIISPKARVPEPILPHPAGIGEIKRINEIDSKSFRAGQLRLFHAHWEELGAPPYILKMIKGYRIPFKTKPPLSMPNFRHQTSQSVEMSEIIEKMLVQGVLEAAEVTPSFISTIFLRPKSDGTLRPIFNLKNLNWFIHPGKFRLINVQRVPHFLQAKDWMAKIDLHQAYFHLPVKECHRRFLRLIYADKLLQMTCLPFGLSSAPKTFASLTNWIAQKLRERGIRILVYLDDFFLVNQDPDTLNSQTQVTLNMLKQLGWIINTKKSVLKPRRALEFLGVMWNPWQNTKYLPERLSTKVVDQTTQLLKRGVATLKDLQTITGLMNFASFVVQRGRLHYRATQAMSNKLLKSATSKHVPLLTDVKQELEWWRDHCKTSSMIHIPPTTHYLTTDASDIGWGAQLDHLDLKGTWLLPQQRLHCNQKEMLAIINVLKDHGHRLSSESLLIQCDSRTVVSYLRNEGGTKSAALTSLTQRLFQILDQFNIHMAIHHIPGNYNCDADHLSRKKVSPEWHLLPRLTGKVFSKWGTPMIDLFASHRARVVTNYCTLDRRDKNAEFHDAFSRIWEFPLAWIFPPPHLIPRVLAHLNNAVGIFLIAVPRWKNAFWRPDLKSRSLAAPFTIRNLESVLVDTTTGLPPPRVGEMSMEIWKCGGGINT